MHASVPTFIWRMMRSHFSSLSLSISLPHCRWQLIGNIYYETECASPSPSLSSLPSSSPTIDPSQSPSFPPTFSFAPTSAPSPILSEVPSSAPSFPPSSTPLETKGGVLVGFNMECTSGGDFKEQNVVVADTIKSTLAGSGKPGLSNVNTEVVAAVCQPVLQRRHLLLNPGYVAENSIRHRQLPTGALEFSVVVTGEYSPPSGEFDILAIRKCLAQIQFSLSVDISHGSQDKQSQTQTSI